MPLPSDPFSKHGATRVCPLAAPLSFCPVNNIFRYGSRNVTNKTFHSFVANDMFFFRI